MNFLIQNIRWIDVLDVAIVAMLIYFIFKKLKGTLAFNILIAIIIIYLISYIIGKEMLNMRLLSRIVNTITNLGVIALIIVFQPEIRRFLINFGRTLKTQPKQLFKKMNFFDQEEDDENEHTQIVMELSSAFRNLSQTKTGVLIVITQSAELPEIIESGVYIGGGVTAKLIESIFQKESPLHDGAAIISNKKIEAANCILPVSDNPKLPPRIGLRHRAAVGITEKSDALAFVISEENGSFSYARAGDLKYDISLDKIEGILKRIFGERL